MGAAHQQWMETGSGDCVALASTDRGWCDQVAAALQAESGNAATVVRLSDPPEARLPAVRGGLWLVDEPWLAPLLAVHAGRGEAFGQLRLIVRFEHPCSERIVQAIEAGARGCLPGDATVGEALRAISAVRSGELWLSRKLFAEVLTHLHVLGDAPRTDGAGAEHGPRLTERQRQIAACVAQGMSNKQIGRRLGISPTTVKTHLHNIFARVGVGGRTLLALRAVDGDAR
jgi:DNA-binding NarL/FixJ family response regulator